MPRAAKPSSLTSRGQNVMLIAFCVIAGFAVTACQPGMKNKVGGPGTFPSPAPDESPIPTGVPVTGTDDNMMYPSSTPANKTDTSIDATLKMNDDGVKGTDPSNVTGADLN